MGYRINSALASCAPTPKTKPACSVADCAKPSRWKGLCSAHYERLRVHGSTDHRPQYENLSGQRFGMLTAVETAPKLNRVVRWVCNCDCGNQAIVQSGNLKSGHTQSCGCQRVSPNLSHGMSNTSTYRSWVAMRRRCNDDSYIEFHLYGGRGITVCERWQNSFEAFLQDMGVRPEGCTLDRKESELGYSPDNCRWATPAEQAKNKRNSAHPGKSLKDICDERGMNVHTVSTRIRRMGMTLEQALSTPLKHGGRHAIGS